MKQFVMSHCYLVTLWWRKNEESTHINQWGDEIASHNFIIGRYLKGYSVILTTSFQDMHKRSIFPEFQLIPILHLQVMHTHTLLYTLICWINYRLWKFMRTFLHFIPKWFLQNSFREICYLGRARNRCKNFKHFESTLQMKSENMLFIHIHICIS